MRDAGQGDRPRRRDRRVRPGDRLQLAGGDHLRQQHRGGLQRLDFLLGIAAAGAVLHHQHAERRAAAQHRHAEERMVDLFAGLRLVGKGRMVLRVRQGERFGGRGDQADEAFARTHGGQMHRLAVEALGGEQLERPVGARDIERAHLGDHVRGDEDDDAVEARLRGDGLRHDLAEPSQQQSRSARRAHRGIPDIVLARNARFPRLFTRRGARCRAPPTSNRSPAPDRPPASGIANDLAARQGRRPPAAGDPARGGRSGRGSV